MMFSTAQLVTTYNVGPITADRPVHVQLLTGAWGEGAPSPITFNPIAIHTPKASKQDRTADRQQDSDKRREQIRVYTVQEILFGDRLLYRGMRWRVVYVAPYNTVAGVYLATAELLSGTSNA